MPILLYYVIFEIGSAKRIMALEPECQVYTVNLYDERERDFVIIVTTRANVENVNKNIDFILFG